MLTIDLAGDHREVLEVGAVVADRLEAGAVEERRDVLGRDTPFTAERIATAHHVRRQEVDVALERVGLDRGQARIPVGAVQRGHEAEGGERNISR